MMSYDAIPVLLRILLMLGAFLTLCGSIYMTPIAIQRKSPRLIVPTLVCVLLSGGIMVLFSADVRSGKHGFAPAAASRWLCEKPAVFAVLLLAVMAAFLVCFAVRELRLRRTTVTRSAIKESIDYLTTGLCFYAENGRVMLVNHRMNQLCHTMLGRDLQNAARLWEDLCSGNVQPGVVRLSAGRQSSFRLPDGTVWTFSREELQGVFQITAADTTQLHKLAGDLERKNIALAALHRRLVQYEENVEELTRERERLETKASIHSQLGQALLATRSYLVGGEEDGTIPVDLWKRSIAMFRLKAEERRDPYSLQKLVQTAKAFGVAVEVEGQAPEEAAAERLFLAAAAEALTNAVRHAGARTLYIRFSETEAQYQVSFQNDGSVPEGEITEGGGLGSLRRKVEIAGGSMDICCRPAYTLTITAKKDGGDIV